MPTGADTRRRESQAQKNPPALNHDLAEEDRVAVAQLQQAIQEAAATENGRDRADAQPQAQARPPSAPPVTDGARRPVTAGGNYTSLRAITRREPKDADAVVAGVDTSNADLSWTAQELALDPNGRPWLYPKTRRKWEGSNLEQFKEEITERTKDGQGCKAIAEILIAKGVDTSARAVARQRMKWGLRQRAKRKMTEQGIANIRKAHAELAKRLANSDPVPVKRVRIRVMRKAEITRMTKEGMSSAAIAENLVARGVKLSRGAATVERLRTIWGLTDGSTRSIINIRASAKAQAQRQQKEQFENIARELGIEDVSTWVRDKMEEEVAQDARREYAYTLMGDARPKVHIIRNKKVRARPGEGRSLSRDQGQQESDDINQTPEEDPATRNGQGVSSSTSAERSPAAADGANAPPEATKVSDNEEDDDDDDDEDEDNDTDADEAEAEAAAQEAAEAQEEAYTRAQQQPPQPAAMDVDSRSPSIQPQPSEQAQQRPPPETVEADSRSPSIPPQISHDNRTVQQNAMPQQQNFASQQPTPPPPQVHNAPPNNVVFYTTFGAQRTDDQQITNANITTAPPAGMPGRPSPHVDIAPRPYPPRPIAPRAIAPRPVVPLTPPSQALKVEADYMAQFGLLPYPTHGKRPQKYLTPTGLITTDGYEYLAAPPPPYGPPPPQPRAVHGYPGSDYIVISTPPPSHAHAGHGYPGPDYVAAHAPPQPQPPPPPPKVSRIPAPPLTMPPEEVEGHMSDHGRLQKYQKVTQDCMDLIAARASGRPVLNSLTGLPPSLRDIQSAKEKVKEAATALLAEL